MVFCQWTGGLYSKCYKVSASSHPALLYHLLCNWGKPCTVWCGAKPIKFSAMNVVILLFFLRIRLRLWLGKNYWLIKKLNKASKNPRKGVSPHLNNTNTHFIKPMIANNYYFVNGSVPVALGWGNKLANSFNQSGFTSTAFLAISTAPSLLPEIIATCEAT